MRQSRIKAVLLLLVLILTAFIISACGQKGDLYQPDEEQSSIVPQVTTTV